MRAAHFLKNQMRHVESGSHSAHHAAPQEAKSAFVNCLKMTDPSLRRSPAVPGVRRGREAGCSSSTLLCVSAFSAMGPHHCLNLIINFSKNDFQYILKVDFRERERNDDAVWFVGLWCNHLSQPAGASFRTFKKCW